MKVRWLALALTALAAPGCPLDEREKAIGRRNVAFSAAKSAWHAAKRGHLSLAWHRVAASSITPAEWLRYLRPPQRSARAGMDGHR